MEYKSLVKSNHKDLDYYVADLGDGRLCGHRHRSYGAAYRCAKINNYKVLANEAKDFGEPVRKYVSRLIDDYVWGIIV